MNIEQALHRLTELVTEYGIHCAEYEELRQQGKAQACQRKTIDIMDAQTKVVMFVMSSFEVKK